MLSLSLCIPHHGAARNNSSPSPLPTCSGLSTRLSLPSRCARVAPGGGGRVWDAQLHACRPAHGLLLVDRSPLPLVVSISILNLLFLPSLLPLFHAGRVQAHAEGAAERHVSPLCVLRCEAPLRPADGPGAAHSAGTGAAALCSASYLASRRLSCRCSCAILPLLPALA